MITKMFHLLEPTEGKKQKEQKLKITLGPLNFSIILFYIIPLKFSLNGKPFTDKVI